MDHCTAEARAWIAAAQALADEQRSRLSQIWRERANTSQRFFVENADKFADQQDLMDWYENFEGCPPVYLVHGEGRAQRPLAKRLRKEFDAPVIIAERGQEIDI